MKSDITDPATIAKLDHIVLTDFFTEAISISYFVQIKCSLSIHTRLAMTTIICPDFCRF